jgi:acetylornithine/N-succinyldiaminopimelate aminotransferase
LARSIHISNFFTTRAQIELAETTAAARRRAPDGSRVFFTNSGTESMEAAIKLARRTGRPGSSPRTAPSTAAAPGRWR